MSWQLASLLVLGAALAAGFAWYERTHPTSRMLALVATLAALAAIGRVAFAAAAERQADDRHRAARRASRSAARPGFVVGAVAALASNLVFGQGPWTPWQMVAWGLCGLIGAGLGRATGRHLGRIPLALACGAGRARLRRDHGRLGVGDLRRAADGGRSTWRSRRPRCRSTSRTRSATSSSAWPSARRSCARCCASARAWRCAGPTRRAPACRRADRRRRARAAAGRAAGRSAARRRRRRRRRAGGALPRPRAERRRRLGRRAARRLERDADLLDGDRVGRRRRTTRSPCGATDARRRRCCAATPPARARRPTSSAPPWRSAQPASPARPAAWPDASSARSAPTARSAGWSTSRPSARSRCARSACRRARGASQRATAWLAAASEPRRRLQLRRARRPERHRRHRRGGRGARRRRAIAPGAPSRRAASWLRRAIRIPTAATALQPPAASNAQSTAFAVQAPRGRRAQPGSPASPRRALARRLPALAPGPNGSVRYSRTSTQTPVWVTAEALAALARRPLPIRVVRR